MTENIFLSYRRDDSRGYTNAIYTLLELHFPADSIFMDVDTLIPGSDFVLSLQDAVENCDIFLAVIGKSWENIEDQKGLRRLDNPEDFVRIEVAHALKRGIPVIPVLVDGAQMPSSDNLPDNLKDLARRHAFSIGDHMRSDMQRLIKVLEKTFERLEKERLEKEKKEAELLARAQAEEERIAQEKAEADLIAKEKAEANLIAKEKTGADRIAKEKAEEDRIAKEKAEVDRKANEKAEADRKAKEKAEANRKAKEKAEADRKAKEQAQADRKAKKKAEADQKAKAQIEGKRKKEKIVSSPLPLLKKIPVWVWPVAGTVLITIGYGVFGGFSPSQSEEAGKTETVQVELQLSSTPIIAAGTETPMPSSTPVLEIGSTKISPVDGMVQVYIPAGEFLMGSNSGEKNAQPVHEVYLDGFWMDEHEVTAEQFQAFMEETNYSADPKNSGDYPVAGVHHPDASSYCEWAGRRLPTEAEWEKAARGGLEGKLYPWGDEYFNNVPGAIKGAQGGNDVHDPINVKAYAPNGYGLFDMAGNVCEWTGDFYVENYSTNSPVINPTGPQDGDWKIIRGGSWFLWMNNLRVDHRYWSTDSSDGGADHIGFRCAQSVGPEEPPAAEPLDNADVVNSTDGAVVVYLPSGDFLMGSDNGESDESPAHSVYLDGFWIYQTEVTNSTYKKCVQAGVCTVPDISQNTQYYDLIYADHPMVYVNWYDSDIYCEWAGGRLPTEAEWEKAARGTDGRTYPWGDYFLIEDYANYGAIVGDTMPVGSYPTGQSPYGLMDMAGNVAEWVGDWYDSEYYQSSPSENPTGPDAGFEKLLRGGSWNLGFEKIQTTSRQNYSPDFSFKFWGFRCVTSQ